MEVALGSMVFIRSWGGGEGDGKESYTEMDWNYSRIICGVLCPKLRLEGTWKPKAHFQIAPFPIHKMSFKIQKMQWKTNNT